MAAEVDDRIREDFEEQMTENGDPSNGSDIESELTLFLSTIWRLSREESFGSENAEAEPLMNSPNHTAFFALETRTVTNRIKKAV